MDGFGRYWTDLAPFCDDLGGAGAESRHFRHIHVAVPYIHVPKLPVVVGLLYIHVGRLTVIVGLLTIHVRPLHLLIPPQGAAGAIAPVVVEIRTAGVGRVQ